MVGVTFSRPARQPEGIWQARLHRADQRPVVKTFAVKRHGFDTAFAKAVEARRLMVESIGDELYLRDDYARQVARAAGHVTAYSGVPVTRGFCRCPWAWSTGRPCAAGRAGRSLTSTDFLLMLRQPQQEQEQVGLPPGLAVWFDWSVRLVLIDWLDWFA